MKGYAETEKEFDTALREIVKMGYGLVLVSHAQTRTVKNEKGEDVDRISPTLDKRASKVVNRMADVTGYSTPVTHEDGSFGSTLFLRGTPSYIAGGRFKYLPFSIDFSYENLVNAIQDAIAKEEAEVGSDKFTEVKQASYQPTEKLDYDKLILEFNDLVKSIPGSNANADPEIAKHFKEHWIPIITEITERYLGKGKKVNTSTRDQVEAISLIVDDLKGEIEDSQR